MVVSSQRLRIILVYIYSYLYIYFSSADLAVASLAECRTLRAIIPTVELKSLRKFVVTPSRKISTDEQYQAG